MLAPFPRTALACALAAVLLAWASAALAQDATPPVPAAAAAKADIPTQLRILAEGDFNAKAEATTALAATGDPRVGPILRAMMEGALYVRQSDKALFIGQASRTIVALKDALTQADAGTADAADVDVVRVNNRLRGSINSALGLLQLMHADAATRKQSADALFKNRSAEMIPVLELAMAQETDKSARTAMARTLAASQFELSEDLSMRVQALAVLAGYADADVRALIADQIQQIDGQQNPSPEVLSLRKAAAAAVKSIEYRLSIWSMFGNVLQGISLGSVLLLAAIGLAITFGVMGVINMAHGEMVMLGAYTTFAVQSAFQAWAPGALSYSLLVSIPAAFIVSGLVGIAIERTIIRFLYGRPLETLLATWGLSLVLQQAVRSGFGPTNRQVVSPPWMSGAMDLAGGVVVTYNRIWILVFALLVFGLLILFQRRTSFGLQMRAVTQNRRMARSMGIRSGLVDALTFGLGSGIAGVAGVALSQIDNVSPNLGQSYIIDSFMVVVFGGVGNLWGTLVGAFGLGIVNKFLEPYAGAVLGKIVVLVAIILFIQRRPRGLFAQRGRAVEA